MRITLIDFTGSGHPDPADYAASVLIFTKNTRLTMSPGLFEEIRGWSAERKAEELAYMANTIPSSWEFVDYTFLISGVTRAFTHQFVRTRTASFAQQTMRVLDVSTGPGWDCAVGPSIKTQEQLTKYDRCMATIDETYKELIKDGVKIEDARGVLPTNILTNIVVKMNMRTFAEMVRKRTSPRTQGEYRAALQGMTKEAIKVHPWLELFIDQNFDKAAKDLDAEIAEVSDETKRIRMMKLVDQMRQRG